MIVWTSLAASVIAFSYATYLIVKYHKIWHKTKGAARAVPRLLTAACDRICNGVTACELVSEEDRNWLLWAMVILTCILAFWTFKLSLMGLFFPSGLTWEYPALAVGNTVLYVMLHVVVDGYLHVNRHSS